jgi:ABC-type lipoprotein release transport system permease subunit
VKRWSYWWVLTVVSLRNIVAHRVKSLVVGLLVALGVFLVITGTALLDSVEDSMSKSVTSSLAGHVQLYSADARDDLALFGSMMMAQEDIGRIESFEALRQVVEPLANVEAVVPMGIDFASVTSGNEVDKLADRLRTAVANDDKRAIRDIRAQLALIVGALRKETEAAMAIAQNPEEVQARIPILDRVVSDEFWDRTLDDTPELAIQHIESKVAPLFRDGLQVYLRYVGTDLEKFRKHFDRFEIVKGQVVPPGRRGFLFADRFYETQVKHKVARDLDKIYEWVVREGKHIDEDKMLGALVRQIRGQYRRITQQLRPDDAELLRQDLSKLLGASMEDLDVLLERFLSVDDENIETRYRYFYEHIAPKLELYQIPLGQPMTIRAYTRSGYLKAINIFVYGTFNFRGLETSDLAGAANLMDIASFRDLYGLMSERRREELQTIKASVQAQTLAQPEDVEAAFFGNNGIDVEAQAPPDESVFDEFASGKLRPAEEARSASIQEILSTRDINEGVALNAAVVLKNTKTLEATKIRIEEALAQTGFRIKAVGWAEAAGIVGQFITVIRIVLYAAISIVFLVALVIINNTMVMATLERTTEIGTLRAIGAQRGVILCMFLLETVVLGFIAGGLGACLGAAFIAWLGHVGIPAGTQDVLVFLFGGPRLYPGFGASNVLLALTSILLVSLASTLYPARMASRIQPVVAMQGKE